MEKVSDKCAKTNRKNGRNMIRKVIKKIIDIGIEKMEGGVVETTSGTTGEKWSKSDRSSSRKNG